MEDVTIIEGTRIKNHLPALLGDRKMSLRSLAEETGIAYTIIRDVYHGHRRSVQWQVIDKLCETLGVGVGDLFEYLGNKESIHE